ncbi:solute carrier family 35, member C2 [Kwoniella mangroviensis CBS 10435]|uniref:Solute carrier family 35, member C2 n=1 Tax=Kwoniella mangroviensis CBS 10435 TaxID=1331196 RepID=A0A1B9IJG8_9TREE|nr:solute carrier family 35, member C2 [Kwoniella mangroviensis CBS 10435]
MNDVSSSAGPSRPPHRLSPSPNPQSSFSTPSQSATPDVPPAYEDSSGPPHRKHSKGGDHEEEEEEGLIYARPRQNQDEGDVGVIGVDPGHESHRHATLEMKKALWWKNVIITGMFILSWYTFATLLSLYNKWMFSPNYYGFSYPLFVTCCHMVVQFGLAALIRVILADRFRPKERPTRKEYVTKILPTAAATGGDIGLSNLSLKTITLSLYTMCKSSTLIFVLLFAFTFKLEAYSLRLISVITLISFGVFCMVFNTTAVSIPGIIMVFTASGLGGLRWALTELVMHKKGMGLSNPFATIFWLAPLMAVTLALVSMVVEGWFDILSSDFFVGFQAIKTMGVIVLPGAIAFAMVASEYFIIQRAGVVPLSIAGIFKEVSTISISSWVFGDQLTGLNIIGVVITVCGIALYSYHKYQKSMASTVELDAYGKPILSDDTSPLIGSDSHRYTTTPQNDHEHEHQEIIDRQSAEVPLTQLGKNKETEEERTQRLRDDFEGWDNDNNGDDGWSEDEPEAEEVQRSRDERLGNDAGRKNSRGDWWDKEI